MRNVLYVVVFLAIAADGYFYGSITARWTEAKELQEARARISKIPAKLGNWQGTDLVLGERERDMAGFSEYVYRRYENTRSGGSVMLLLACGPAGPLSVHSPEVCYQGLGYQAIGEPKALEVKAGKVSGRFWAASFAKRDSHAPAPLRIVYAWNKREGWTAPDNPRMAFAGAPVLFKLYVTQALGEDQQTPGGDDLSTEFLKELLPELQAKLF